MLYEVITDLGLFGSEWVGFENFKFFFQSQDAWRVTRNTIGLNAIFIVLVLIFSVSFAILLSNVTKKLCRITSYNVCYTKLLRAT